LKFDDLIDQISFNGLSFRLFQILFSLSVFLLFLFLRRQSFSLSVGHLDQLIFLWLLVFVGWIFGDFEIVFFLLVFLFTLPNFLGLFC
jgi:hypothetical protein